MYAAADPVQIAEPPELAEGGTLSALRAKTRSKRAHDEIRDAVIESFRASASARGDAFQSAIGVRLGDDRNRIRPDALITTASGDKLSTFFIEVDRSTERLEILLQKCRRYSHLLMTGGYARYSRLPASRAKERPFRVLFYVKSEGRARNIAQLLSEKGPKIQTLVWFTASGPTADAFSAQWTRAIDYFSTPADADVAKRALL